MIKYSIGRWELSMECICRVKVNLNGSEYYDDNEFWWLQYKIWFGNNDTNYFLL